MTLEEKAHIEKDEKALSEKSDEMKYGETAEKSAERLTEEYAAKGQKENKRGQQAVTKFVENGKKEGLKVA